MIDLKSILIILFVGFFSLMSCKSAEEPEEKDRIELDGFSWEKPTWKRHGSEHYWFNGPIKAVKTVWVLGDGEKHPMGILFDDLEYPLPLDLNLKELTSNYYIFDRYGRKMKSESISTLGYEKEDTSILSLNIDSIIYLLDMGVKRGRKPIYDNAFYNSMISTYDEVQKAPRFLSTLKFEAPFCLSISTSSMLWGNTEYRHKAPNHLPKGVMYYHIFETGKLKKNISEMGILRVKIFQIVYSKKFH